MFSIGPFHHSAGQPAGFFDSLFPQEPLPSDAVPSAPAPAVADRPAMGLGRQALAMVLLVALTLGVNSAAGLWALSDHATRSAPVQVASAHSPS